MSDNMSYFVITTKKINPLKAGNLKRNGVPAGFVREKISTNCKPYNKNNPTGYILEVQDALCQNFKDDVTAPKQTIGGVETRQKYFFYELTPDQVNIIIERE